MVKGDVTVLHVARGLDGKMVYLVIRQTLPMLKNYLKTAWRNLLRNKAHTAINLSGLSVGLTCGLLILLWLQSELAVDGYHANGVRIYKLYERAYQNNAFTADYDMPAPLWAALEKQIPEIEYAVNTDESAPLRAFRGGNKTAKVAEIGRASWRERV